MMPSPEFMRYSAKLGDDSSVEYIRMWNFLDAKKDEVKVVTGVSK